MPEGLDAGTVARCFETILQRTPESPAVVAHYQSLGVSETELVRILLDSNEFLERHRRRLALRDLEVPAGAGWPRRGKVPRVLLFGAFGNGNIGDAAQAQAVAALLRRMLPGGLDVAASSWERAAAYTAKGARVLGRDALLRPDWLAAGDPMSAQLVVIGGGGLFGTPHFPLHDAGWATWFPARGVPYALLGIGGSATALSALAAGDAYRRLIAGACFVGARDAETLAAVREIRADATWFPDPILAAELLASTRKRAQNRPIDVLLIPRFPNSAQDMAANRGALAFRAEATAAGKRVVIAALEPKLDRQVLAGEEVAYLSDWAELAALCAQARCVASARYHGVIAGLAAGCVVHGLVQPKIGSLLDELGLGTWFCAEGWPEAGLPDDEAAFTSAASAGLANFAARLQPTLTATAKVLATALGRG